MDIYTYKKWQREISTTNQANMETNIIGKRNSEIKLHTNKQTARKYHTHFRDTVRRQNGTIE